MWCGRRWTGSSPDATTLYLAAMDAMHNVRWPPAALPLHCRSLLHCRTTKEHGRAHALTAVTAWHSWLVTHDMALQHMRLR